MKPESAGDAEEYDATSLQQQTHTADGSETRDQQEISNDNANKTQQEGKK